MFGTMGIAFCVRFRRGDAVALRARNQVADGEVLHDCRSAMSRVAVPVVPIWMHLRLRIEHLAWFQAATIVRRNGVQVGG
ncbi:hypothetical protein LPU83_pLPU83a_0054 (plasmid) [Rhizobium favelukesii]|uniref:Uncharacterized protein n=1 Tax=Rhizobium favelukesii TaxID=348824 RepID=W6RHN2_9HYPH|nr:hypothetical protein LPU83_pLPU83a_0054 [Rhizobium favelukesii]